MLTVFVGQFKADPLFEAPEMTLRVSIRSVFVVTLEKKSFLVSALGYAYRRENVERKHAHTHTHAGQTYKYSNGILYLPAPHIAFKSQTHPRSLVHVGCFALEVFGANLSRLEHQKLYVVTVVDRIIAVN